MVAIRLFVDETLGNKLTYGVIVLYLLYKLVGKLIYLFQGRRDSEFRLKSINHGFQKYSLITIGAIILTVIVIIKLAFDTASISIIAPTIGLLCLGNGILFLPEGVVRINDQSLSIFGKEFSLRDIVLVKIDPNSLIVVSSTNDDFETRNLIVTSETASELILFLSRKIESEKIEISERFTSERTEID